MRGGRSAGRRHHLDDAPSRPHQKVLNPTWRTRWNSQTEISRVCGVEERGVFVNRMKYPCLYADEDGESHFKDVEIEFQEADFAPPAPPVGVSSFRRATLCGFLNAPAGWYADWHPTPQRQFFFILRGQAEVRVSDGEVRAFGPGDTLLVEDTTGKCHITRFVGATAFLSAVVQLPD